MADFETKLRWLSERGNPVGAEELIERIEADLAGDPLVVVAKRREGTLMNKTQQPQGTGRGGRLKGPAWAAAAFVAVLAVAGIYLATAGDNDSAEPTPTTAAPVETMTDLEVIEAGVAAFYSGDAERAAALFELPDRTDDEVRQEAAYQAAIAGRLSGVDCAESTPGTFECSMEYHNALVDAANAVDVDDWWWSGVWEGVEVVVADGVITGFMFPEAAIHNIALGSLLAAEGRLEGYEDCVFGPFSESCAVIQLENLDALAEWYAARVGSIDQPDPGGPLVSAALQAWFGGDCEGAHYLAGAMFHVDGVMFDNGYKDGADTFCPPSASSTQTIEYESILGAEVTVEACEEGGGFQTLLEFDNLGGALLNGNTPCTVHYSNAMNTAVGKPPSVTIRDFLVSVTGGFVMTWDSDDWFGIDTVAWDLSQPWYQGVYPEDTELRESFRLFAEGGELRDEYASANCATKRTPDCANLIMDNLDDWAGWYETNR